jgi:hypothetical protein
MRKEHEASTPFTMEVGVQESEWFPVGLTPVAQDPALADQN